MSETATGLDLHTSWYAVRTRPRHERVVRSLLAEKSFSVFLPEHKVWSRRRDKRQVIQVPLFPSYLFVGTESNQEKLQQVKWTRGVVHVLGVNGDPIPVPHQEVKALQILVASGEKMSPLSYLVPGSRVRILEGPLAGAEGKVLRRGKRSRLVVTVNLLQRAVAVELAEYQLEKIK